MNRLFFCAKPFVVAAIALGAIGAATMAQARDDARFTIAVGEPHGHYQPAPEYHRNARGGPLGDADRDGIPNRFDRDSRFYDWRAAQRHAAWGDADRDGVPNRFDRAPYNPRWR
jgi:hypothetical protein